MCSLMRLYLEPRADLPDHMKPDDYPTVIDCEAQEVVHLKRYYQHKGYSVLVVPI